jgi:hypothetical protein
MELNAEHVESLMEGLVAVPEEMLWAEMKRRRAERNRKKRQAINHAYYEQRKAKAKEAEGGVALAPPSSSV